MADMDDWEPTSSEARLAQALFRRVDEVAAEAAQRHTELSQTVHVMEGDLRLLGRRVGGLAVKTSLVDRRQLALSRHIETAVECRLDSADEALERMEAQHVGFDGRFDAVDRRLIRLTMWSDGADERFDKLTTWVGRADEKFDRLEFMLALAGDHADETDKRFAEIAVWRETVDAWRRQVDVWRDDVDHWRGEVDIWRGDVDKRFDRIDAWRRDVDVWRVSVDTKLDKILVAVGAATSG